MEIRDASSMSDRTDQVRRGVAVTHLFPAEAGQQAMLALDLWELEPGGRLPLHAHAEEHIGFVISGVGELTGSAEKGPSAHLSNAVLLHVGPHEVHSMVNTGDEPLRVLVATPLLVRPDRARGAAIYGSSRTAIEGTVEEEGVRDYSQPDVGPARSTEPTTEVNPEIEQPSREDHEVAPDAGPSLEGISHLLKKGNEVAAKPKTGRAPGGDLPRATVEPAQPAEAEEDESSSTMELLVAFDGGSRGNPGQGYGSYMVQSPGRKPVIKRVELGPSYTNNEAEYDTLLACLEYIIDRLEITNRSSEHVQLHIKSDSDLVVNQLLGGFKVKEPNMRARHDRALELLGRFADWMIEWQPREESVKLFGH